MKDNNPLQECKKENLIPADIDFEFDYDGNKFLVLTIPNKDDWHREVWLLGTSDEIYVFKSIDDAIIWIEAQVITQAPSIYFEGQAEKLPKPETKSSLDYDISPYSKFGYLR